MCQTTPLPLSSFNLPLSDNNFTITRPSPHIPDPIDIDPSDLQKIQAHKIPIARKTVRPHSQIETSNPLRCFELPILEPLHTLTNRFSDIDSCTFSLIYPHVSPSTHSSFLDNLLDLILLLLSLFSKPLGRDTIFVLINFNTQNHFDIIYELNPKLKLQNQQYQQLNHHLCRLQVLLLL